MTNYANHESGVVQYEIIQNAIRVWFQDGSEYLYTSKSAGRKNIEIMQKLATIGKGLATFINQRVSGLYEK